MTDQPRGVEEIRASVVAGTLSGIAAIGEIRLLTGCGLREAVAILDGAPPPAARPALHVVAEPEAEEQD